LQPVLDEYFHILKESLGLLDHTPEESAIRIADEVTQALSIRPASLQVDQIHYDQGKVHVEQKSPTVRCRYALRFGDEKSETLSGGVRDTNVRVSFNSPFRPFVLATTSIGQEGLDFHQYCRKVVHWNLPSNPVDLEQREGRIQRYKGQVIRQNLAEAFSYRDIQLDPNGFTDVWKNLFALAVSKREKDLNDLVPFWIYEGKYFIERQLPLLPFSREITQIRLLQKSLVAYRSVIGQSRQQELLETIVSQLSEEQLSEIAKAYSIDLSPPHFYNAKIIND
jgi:hypothetical protein